MNLVDLARQMEQLDPHQELSLAVSDDPLLLADIEAWCHRHGHGVQFFRNQDGTRLVITPGNAKSNASRRI